MTIIVPVGAGAPFPPLTVTVTESAWVMAILEEDGVTTIAGVTLATVTLGEVPVEPLYVSELEASGK
jgi:hypothetical protein